MEKISRRDEEQLNYWIERATKLAIENERLRDYHSDGISFGIALSVAFLIRDRGENTVALEWWDASGLTIAECERIGVDEYDLAPIRSAR